LIAITVLLIIPLMQGFPTPPGLRAPAAQAAEKDPGPAPPPPPPLPDEQREETHVETESISDVPGPDPKDIAFQESPEDTLKGFVEDPEARQQNAIAYASGGTHLVEVFGEPVSYQDDMGTWQPIDLGLESQQEGSFKNGADSFAVDFPKELGAGSPVTVTIGSGSYTVVPEKIPTPVPVTTKDDVTVVYPKVYPGLDFTYTLVNGGFKEQVTVASVEEAQPIVYDLVATGLTFRQEKTGEISILNGDQVVSTMPLPFAVDSSSDPDTKEPAYGNASFTLSDLGGGTYQLTVTVDEEFLKTAVFPLTIDPSQYTLVANRDTWTEVGDGVGHASDAELTARTQTPGPQSFSYLYFDVSSLIQPGTSVLGAHIYLYGTYIGDPTKAMVAQEITADWPTTVTWASKPDASSTELARLTRSTPGWFDIDATAAFQAYFAGTATNRGIRISSDGYHRFASVENTDQSHRPGLLLSVNHLPSAPTLSQPDAGAEVLHASPALSVEHPVFDQDGDNVKVQYQVAKSSGGFESDLAFSSWWVDDEPKFTLPSGILDAGKDYYWRARSWDVCVPPDGMCADTQNNWPASPQRKITHAPDQIGDDPRWSMYGESLGNAMTLKVNEATGNLFLNYPLDSLATPIGPLDISLTYNHHDYLDSGLGLGWTITAGPGSDPRQLPMSLEVIEDGDAVKVHFADGDEQYFSPINDSQSEFYSSGGMRGGVLHKSTNDSGVTQSWRLRTSSGGLFTFDANGDLDTAKPKTSSALTAGFTYHFTDSQHRLDWVRDPWLRKVTFTWSEPDESKLLNITIWGEGDPSPQRIWTIKYDTDFHDPHQNDPPATSSHNIIDRIIDPAGGKVRFYYAADLAKMTEIVDGEGKDTTITWQHPGSDPPKWQVQKVTHPVVGDTLFEYFGPFIRQVAAYTYITDRRGTVTSDLNDYKTSIDFSKGGFPVRIVNPPIPVPGVLGGWVQGITRMAWDSNGNMVCRRGPAGDAYIFGGDGVCVQNNAPPSDGRQTADTYDGEAPFRLLTETSPGPDVDNPTVDRQVTTRTYDDGITGLYREAFDSEFMKGVPQDVRIANNVDQSWSPTPENIANDGDWSVRYTGFLRPPIDTGHDLYYFRVYSDAGVRLVIDERVLVDCFNDDGTFSAFNCGDASTPLVMDLWAGRHRITVEYRHRAGDPAQVRLNWSTDPDSGFTTIGTDRYQPNLGALTNLTDPLGHTDYSYTGDDHWIQHLPDTETRPAEGLNHIITRTYENGTLWWRPLTEINNLDTPGTFTKVWWAESNHKACLNETIDRAGAVTHYDCDSAGRITSVTVDVDAQRTQTPGQNRTTTFGFDAVGRPTTTITTNGVTPPITTRTVTNVWDLAGRLKQVNDSWTDGSTTKTRVTDYEYDEVGRLKKVTYPDPDDGGIQTRPYVQHAYDLVGNEITYTDANLKVWTKGYDALNRATSSTPPVAGGGAATTGTVHDDTGEGGGHPGIPRTTVTSPHGVPTVTTVDLLGRPKAVQVGSLLPTNYTYVGTQTVTVTDPTGVWNTTIVNSFGQTKEADVPDPIGTGTAVTAYAHDKAGRLDTVTDPLTRVTDYNYDGEGRVISVDPAGASPAWTFEYDDAGELIWVQDPDTPHQERDSNYDALGRASQTKETRNGGVVVTTTETYDGFSQLVKQQATTSGSSGRDLRFEYDQLGRRTRRYCAAQCTNAADEHFYYDPAGNMTKAEGNTSNTKVQVTYDDWGRPSQVTAGTLSAVTATTTYAYEKDRLQSRQDAANGPPGTVYSTTSYTYEAATDRLTGISTSGTGWGSTTVSNAYTYDAAGRLDTRTTTPGNLIVDRDYLAGLLKTEAVKRGTTSLSSFTYTYDDVGNVKQLNQQLDIAGTITGDESGVWDYQVDDLDRLTQAKFTPTGGSAQTTNYLYDWAGNRTSVQVVGQSTITTTYDSAGLPISSSDGFTYTFDLEGNLTGRLKTGQNRTFAYDAWGRTTSASIPSVGTINYAYDALDRQVSRTSSTTSNYRYSGITQDPVQITTGTPTAYAYGLSAPVAQSSGGTTRLYVPNLHGDLSLVANTAGSLTDTQSYSPWGEKRVTTGTTNPAFAFQSDLTDKDTSLVDMGARLYYPALGRFMTRDLLFGDLKTPLSMNRYIYGADDPISRIDPDGLCPRDPDNPGVCSQTSSLDDVKATNPRWHPEWNVGGPPTRYSPSWVEITTAVDLSGLTVTGQGPPGLGSSYFVVSKANTILDISALITSFPIGKSIIFGQPGPIYGYKTEPATGQQPPGKITVVSASATYTIVDDGYLVDIRMALDLGSGADGFKPPLFRITSRTGKVHGGSYCGCNEPRNLLEKYQIDPRWTMTEQIGWLPSSFGPPKTVSVAAYSWAEGGWPTVASVTFRFP
jgi:RHS repeat-associated protein